MNERINELFDTALDAVIPNTWTNLNMDQLNDIKNKFAELIVKECMDAVGDSPMGRPYIQRIKSKFGVEYYESMDKAFDGK